MISGRARADVRHGVGSGEKTKQPILLALLLEVHRHAIRRAIRREAAIGHKGNLKTQVVARETASRTSLKIERGRKGPPGFQSKVQQFLSLNHLDRPVFPPDGRNTVLRGEQLVHASGRLDPDHLRARQLDVFRRLDELNPAGIRVPLGDRTALIGVHANPSRRAQVLSGGIDATLLPERAMRLQVSGLLPEPLLVIERLLSHLVVGQTRSPVLKRLT